MSSTMDDSCIIELYLARSETAIAETAQKYGRYCHAIAKNILACDADAEEVVNDTYLKTWNTIPPHRPISLKSYVGMLARHLALDAYEAQNAQKRGGQMPLVLEELSECLPDGGESEPMNALALRDALNRFLRSLPARTQTIFIRRYWYAASVSEIAHDFGMRESAVTVLMLRTRKKLKQHLQKEGIDL